MNIYIYTNRESRSTDQSLVRLTDYNIVKLIKKTKEKKQGNWLDRSKGKEEEGGSVIAQVPCWIVELRIPRKGRKARRADRRAKYSYLTQTDFLDGESVLLPNHDLTWPQQGERKRERRRFGVAFAFACPPAFFVLRIVYESFNEFDLFDGVSTYWVSKVCTEYWVPCNAYSLAFVIIAEIYVSLFIYLFIRDVQVKSRYSFRLVTQSGVFYFYYCSILF